MTQQATEARLLWALAFATVECPCEPEIPHQRCGPCADWAGGHSPYCYGTLEEVLCTPVEQIPYCNGTSRVYALEGVRRECPETWQHKWMWAGCLCYNGEVPVEDLEAWLEPLFARGIVVNGWNQQMLLLEWEDADGRVHGAARPGKPRRALFQAAAGALEGQGARLAWQ